MAEMSTGTSIHDLEEFKGVFDWDTDKLIANIKASKPYYFVDDPATWPRITTTAFYELKEGPFVGKYGLPFGLVYPPVVIHEYVDRESDRHHDTVLAGQKRVVRPFDYFPYHYDRYGNERSVYHLTRDDQLHYTSSFSDLPAPKLWSLPLAPSSLPLRPGRRQLVSHAPKSPDVAYTEVLQMIAKHRTNAKQLQDYDTIEKNLAKMQEQLEKEKTGTKKKEAYFKRTQAGLRHNLAKQVEKSDKDMKALKTVMGEMLETERARACTAEERVKALELELAASRNETILANERVMKIWTQMKGEDGEGVSKKRKTREHSGFSDVSAANGFKMERGPPK